VIAALLLIVVMFSPAAWAQEKFAATVDHTTVRVGETVTLTITLDGASSGVPSPELPPLENLQIVAGPYSNSSLSIVNGRASASASFMYMLRPQQAGKAQIGAAKLKYKGREFATAPITINVLASGAGNAAGGSSARGGNERDVFIRVIPDKTEAYLGEQITLTYKIYFCVQLTNPEMVRLPRATGFWVEDISLPSQAVLMDEVVGGKAYKSAVIRKSALFATSVGDQEVEPLVVNTKIQQQAPRRGRDPFDIFNDPFFQLGRQMVPLEVESPSLKLHIKPLPQTDTPAGFNGAVGNYKIHASLDKLSCKTDEGATLTVQIDGVGSIKTLPEPTINFPADIQKYDPEASEDIRRNQARISGTKTFKYVIIPRAQGVQTIPPILFSFFDPERKQYSTVSTAPLRLTVEKGTGVSSTPSGIAVASKHGVESVATDIAFAKTHPGNFVSDLSLPHQNAGFWFYSLSPWVILSAVVLVGRRRELKGEVHLKKKAALRHALRSLQAAEKAAKSAKPSGVVKEVASIVENLLVAALGPGAMAKTSSELAELWNSTGLEPALLDRILDVQRSCDHARFAAGTISRDEMNRMIVETRAIAAAFGKNSHRKKAA
jgi:hypothetical protein